MESASDLNSRFGLGPSLTFQEQNGGLIVASIDNAHATASICLQGAHLMTWQPKSQVESVLWMSRDAKLLPGKSIRGGVPVCWPWFGPHKTEATFPAHGFARSAPWQVVASGIEADGATRLTLRLATAKTQYWPYTCSLELTVIVGATLRMSLNTSNTGTEDFAMSEALHTYFTISDIANVSVSGLDAETYWDTVGGVNKKTQIGEIQFDRETDRVYINSPVACVIEDPQLKRRIHINKSGSLSTVVWNPWTDKAHRMGDLGQPDGWRGMLCVESANAWDNTLTLLPEQRHELSVEYKVEAI